MEKELKILLLEDQLYDYELIIQELNNSKIKYNSKLISDEKSFKNAIKSFKPDLILSNYYLTQYNGMSALMHTLDVAPAIPFIIVTKSINEEIAVDCIKAGATDYVTKKHLSRLIYAIKAALKKKKNLNEQELIKNKLIESEEKYRRLYEDSIDPILIIEDYKFADCNNVTVRFLNYKNKSQLLNKFPSDLSPKFQPDGKSSKDKAIEMMNLALKNGNHHFEWVHLTKDKKKLWVDVSLTHIPTLRKNRLYTIWRNITDRKNAEITREVIFNISESSGTSDSLETLSGKIHQELGKIIDNTNFYIALYNAKNNTYTFPFYKDQYEIINTEEKFNLNDSITDYVRKKGKAIRITQTIEKELNKIEKIKSIGKPSLVWVGAPLINTSSNKIIGVVAVQNYEDENALTDKDVVLLAFVARNIGTAIAKKKAELAISESEDKFHSLAQTASDAIITINDTGQISFWNKAATHIFQYSHDEIIGKDLHKIIVPSQYHDIIYKGFSNFKKTGKGNILGQSLELTGKRKDGSVFPAELSVYKFQRGRKWHTTGFIRDITKRKNAEFELKKALEKAEESDRLKTAFLANMSHEIRTPMNAILGFSELLTLTDLSIKERNEFIKLIQTNSNALLNLINDIIDIAKIEAEQLQIYIGDFSLNKLISDILKTFNEVKVNQGKADIEINKHTPNNNYDLIIKSDQNRIIQVLSNLLNNALKYTLTGAIDFGYEILENVNNPQIRFFVKDTGIGIPNDKIDVIFERFHQGDGSHTREYGGTGLGLAISQNIAKLLGGEIKVESEEGKGSVFYFTIPFNKSKLIIKQEATPSRSNTNKFNLKGRTILIVENVESNYQLLETYLLKIRANIIWKKNGKEAVDECEKNNKIDIILMDMQMPVMNGFEATKIIKNMRPELPIIAETAFASSGDKEKILKVGCIDYISKPIRADELYDKIEKYINT
jgi:PAS domain S-box-containing protein